MIEEVGLIMFLFSIIHFHDQQSQEPRSSCVWNFPRLGEPFFQNLVLSASSYVKQENLV